MGQDIWQLRSTDWAVALKALRRAAIYGKLQIYLARSIEIKMGKTLYLECRSGISGDMTVAALLDLGADQEVLMKALRSLPVQGFQAEISRVVKAGLDVCEIGRASCRERVFITV